MLRRRTGLSATAAGLSCLDHAKSKLGVLVWGEKS